jgi:hypothetical protein
MSEIFSEKVVAGRRTYFFDVKETKDGDKYLVIGEVTQVGSDLERHRVMVFEENLESFCAGFDKAVEFLEVGYKDHNRRRSQGGTTEVACPNCGEVVETDADDIRESLYRLEKGLNEIRQHFK